MKRMFGLLLLALALPISMFANSVDFVNGGGTLTGSSAGLNLTGSTLIFAKGPSLTLMGNLGTVTFSTGALSIGSLQTGGTLAGGGSFVITGNGTGGIPNGVIFNGSFAGPSVWSVITLANGTHEYTLTGTLTGTWFTGATVNGATVALIVNVGMGLFNGSATLSSQDTQVLGSGLRLITTPEPTSISLFGAGLISFAGLLRRRYKR